VTRAFPRRREATDWAPAFVGVTNSLLDLIFKD
jgi:hypothetical protein